MGMGIIYKLLSIKTYHDQAFCCVHIQLKNMHVSTLYELGYSVEQF